MSQEKNKEEKLEKIRHTLSHIMASAVKDLFPGVKFGMGPITEDGFYYDFDLSSSESSEENIPYTLSDKDFKEIEKRMRKIIKEGISVEQEYKDIDEAIKEEKTLGQKYKAELLEEIKSGERPNVKTDAEQNNGKASYYLIGNFRDLCKGPHLSNTKEIPEDGFKLTRVAGAYWKGDQKREQLQRIYAVAFNTKEELENYLNIIEEAKKRDHRKLGKELDLFTFSDLVGSGLPLWSPKGTLLRNLLDEYVWNLRKAKGYEKVDIPHITKKDLYETSGHWDKFKDELFKMETREGHIFALKPMNCPHHTQIYARKQHSYRELPARYTETTKVYRDEQSGELSGLSRVRSITQDDAHVFCRYSQVKEEISKIWDIVDEFYKSFGFDLEVNLSLRDPKSPEKYLGTEEMWQKSENELREIAKERNIAPIENVGEAAFYGPKIDFIGKDSLGREWQIATIQLDMNMPESFDLFCINESGEKERIVMIHAAIMGSLERFISILIEHTGGHFPTWLSPVQVMLLPINDGHMDYVNSVAKELRDGEIRIEIDNPGDTVGKRIREAELQKIPYILVMGDKEKEIDSVAVRKRGRKEVETIKTKDFVNLIKEEVQNKKIA